MHSIELIVYTQLAECIFLNIKLSVCLIICIQLAELYLSKLNMKLSRNHSHFSAV